MEVASVTWRAVLDAAGEPTRLIGETLTPEQLLVSLTAEPPGGELSDALEREQRNLAGSRPFSAVRARTAERDRKQP